MEAANTQSKQVEQKIDYQHVFQILVEKLQQENLAKQTKIKLISSYNLAKEKEQYKIIESNNLVTQRFVNNEQIENKINQLIKQCGSEIPEKLLQTLKFNYKFDEGDQFPNFENIEKVFDEEKVYNIQHEQGQILVIQWWASWIDDYSQFLISNQMTLNKNEQTWKGKVKYITVNNSNDRTLTIQMLTEIDGWESFDHYILPSLECEFLKALSIQGMFPVTIIVGSDGVIKYNDLSQKLNLEKFINELISPSQKKDQKKQNQLKDESEQNQKQISEKDYGIVEKYLKNELLPILNTKYSSYNGALLFSLNKETSLEGGKTNKKWFPCQIKYIATKKQVSVVSEIMDQIYKKVNKDLFFLSEEFIQDKKQILINHVYNIQLICQQNGIRNLNLSLVKTFSWVIRNNEYSFKSRQRLVQEGECEVDNLSSYKIFQINEELISYSQKCQNCEISTEEIEEFINMGINIQKRGMPFNPIEDLHRINMQENQILSVKEGVILVVVFWAFWCNPCITFLDNLNAIIMKHAAKWKQNVRVAAINLDQEDQETSLMIFEQGWNQMEFFYFNGEAKENPIVSVFNVDKSIPYVMVVGKNKKIAYSGNSEEVDLEKTINDLIDNKNMNLYQREEGKQEEEKAEEIPQLKNQSSGQQQKVQEQYKALKSALNDKQKVQSLINHLEKDKSRNIFTLKMQKKTIFKQQGGQILYSQYEEPHLITTVRICSKDAFTPLTQYLFEKCPKDLLKIQEQLIKTVDVPVGSNCSLCKAVLKPKQETYYWCKWTNQHVCEKCAQEQVQSQQLQQIVFKFMHNLVVIGKDCNPDLLTGIEDYKFGYDFQPTEPDQVNQMHLIACSNCSEDIVGNRYVCMNCLDEQNSYDLCGICVEKAQIPQKKDKQAQTQLQSISHNSSHVVLRILYNIGSLEY